MVVVVNDGGGVVIVGVGGSVVGGGGGCDVVDGRGGGGGGGGGSHRGTLSTLEHDCPSAGVTITSAMFFISSQCQIARLTTAEGFTRARVVCCR